MKKNILWKAALKYIYLTLCHLVKPVCALLADGADEAGGVVGFAQRGDHLPLHKVPAAIAASAVHALVVQRAEILSILHEEAPLGEVTAANCMGTQTFDLM